MLKFRTQPWEHQLDTLKTAWNSEQFLLFDDPGLGKTATSIHILRAKSLAKGRVVRTAIVTLKSCQRGWLDEIEAHAGEAVVRETLILSGTGEQKARQVKTCGKQVLIFNHDSLINQDLCNALKAWRPEFLVIDELHRFKTHNSKRSKNIRPVADVSASRIGLTGSPVLQSTLDLWSQFRIILGPDIVDPNFYAWRARWFIDKNAGMPATKYFPDWRLTLEGKGYIQSLLKKYSHRRLKQHCLDLPPFVRETRYVELSTPAAKHYRELKKDFVTYLANGESLSVDLALTQILRLQQICSGIIRADDSAAPQAIECAKYAVLSELLETLTAVDENGRREKVVIWSCWVPTFAKIRQTCESLGLNTVQIVGNQTSDERQNAIASFRDDPSVNVCIANQAAGGTGINGLQVAPYSVYFSKNHNLEQDIQSNDRTYRGGSERHRVVTRFDIITEGTIEEDIHAALGSKKDLSSLLLDLREKYVQEDRRAA